MHGHAEGSNESKAELAQTWCLEVRLGSVDIGSTCTVALMTSLSLLLFQNGLPDLPVVLIEPHRNHGGIWRIKFSYDSAEQPLSHERRTSIVIGYRSPSNRRGRAGW